MMECRDEGGYALFFVPVIDVLVVLSSGQMNELDRLHSEMRKRGRDGFVYAVRALAPADPRDGLQIRVELQQPSGLRFLDLRLYALSDRRPGDDDGLFRKIRGALGETQQHLIRKTGVDPVGLAGNRVRLMNHGRDLRPSRRQNGSSGSEAAHTQNRLWT